jgi:methyltransferase (TIGR00027 family)
MDTAAPIARVRAEEASLPPAQRLFDDPFAHLFAHDESGATQIFDRLPYHRHHVRLRTRFFDDFVRAGLAAGVTQVVLPGAGFDCRALRLPEIARAGALVFEVDHAEQHEKKWSRLAEAGSARPAQVRPVSLDLGTDALETALVEALVPTGFRRGAATVFVCEGLLGYLPLDAVRRMFAACAAAGGSGSSIGANFHRTAWDPVRMHRRLLGEKPGPGVDEYVLMTARRE